MTISRPKQALILADHPDVGALIADHVRQLGHESQSTSSVSETAQIIGDPKFQVLISDFNWIDGSWEGILGAAQARGDDMPMLLFVEDTQRPLPLTLRGDCCIVMDRFNFQQMREFLTVILADSEAEIG